MGFVCCLSFGSSEEKLKFDNPNIDLGIVAVSVPSMRKRARVAESKVWLFFTCSISSYLWKK